MSIRFKIIVAFLVMTILIMAQSLSNLHHNAQLRTLVHLAIDQNYKAIAWINNLISDIQKLRRYEKEYFIYITDPVNKEKYTRRWRETFVDIRKKLAWMVRDKSGLYDEDDQLRFTNLQDALQFYGAEFEKILERYKKSFLVGNLRDGQNGASAAIQANTMIQAGKDRLAKVLEDMIALREKKIEESRSIVQTIENQFQEVEIISFSLTGIAIAIVSLIVILIPGEINRSLNRLVQKADQISKGHLSEPVGGLPIPEFNALARSLELIRKARIADSLRSANTAKTKEKILLEEE